GSGIQAESRAGRHACPEMAAGHDQIGRGVISQLSPGLHAVCSCKHSMAFLLKRMLYFVKKRGICFSNKNMHSGLEAASTRPNEVAVAQFLFPSDDGFINI